MGVPAATVTYPEPLARLVALSAAPARASEDLPLEYPEALVALYLDAVEGAGRVAGEGRVEKAGEGAEESGGAGAAGVGSILSRFDEIAKKFSEKFGL